MVHTVIAEGNINEVEVIREDLCLIIDKAQGYKSTYGLCVEMLLSIALNQLNDIEKYVKDGNVGKIDGKYLKLKTKSDTKLSVMLSEYKSIDIKISNSDGSFISRTSIDKVK